MESRARVLLLILPLLLAAAATTLFAEKRAAPRRMIPAESFSHLLGGPVELDPLPSPWPSVSTNGLHPGGGSGDALRP
jgi:hypothetical protein